MTAQTFDLMWSVCSISSVFKRRYDILKKARNWQLLSGLEELRRQYYSRYPFNGIENLLLKSSKKVDPINIQYIEHTHKPQFKF